MTPDDLLRDDLIRIVSGVLLFVAVVLVVPWFLDTCKSLWESLRGSRD